MEEPSPVKTSSSFLPASATLLVVFVVFLSLSAYALLHSPLPADNEPHYMVKAKHYWDPSWCRGDLFLESANAHAVFYQVCGLPTRWLTLEQATYLNRFAAHGLFAIGWVSLCGVLFPSRWAAVASIWIYLALHAYDNLSGEWVIGGVEGKVFSYGFLLWGLACWLRSHDLGCGICLGLAISFHPIVGIWSTIGVVFAESVLRIQAQKWKGLIPTRGDLQSAAILTLCALPGLLPACWLLLSGSAEDKLVADYLLVYFRLAHHLDPMRFLSKGVVYYIVLSIAFLLAGFLLRRRPRLQRLWLFGLAALLIALCGLAAGWGPRPADEMHYYLDRMKFLKFYPFRMYDASLPMLIALFATVAIIHWQTLPIQTRPIETRPTAKAKRLPILLHVLIVLAAMAFTATIPSKSNQRYAPAIAGWLDACRWIREQTPATAVILTPPGCWAFKWYAQRQEYSSHKDIPQDAASIVEWNQRIAFRQELRRNGIGYNQADLARMREEGITHLVVSSRRQVDHPGRYRNDWYHIYEIDQPANVE